MVCDRHTACLADHRIACGEAVVARTHEIRQKSPPVLEPRELLRDEAPLAASKGLQEAGQSGVENSEGRLRERARSGSPRESEGGR